ncbi:SDR family NAD(P)-dependent oxidoreductase [Phenylobacterium sp.]|uniref:SDR family NAD(P)-dependent oxidoreductase n=1 Tax=Phenylobacterium sp. TaxID=1871053 RepID=UPI002EDB8081
MPEPEQTHGRLKGWRAIVTGGGSAGDGVGTGRAICVLFAREGARVAVLDQDAGRAEATCAQIAAGGGEARPVVGDVTSAEDCARMTEESVAWLGGLDVLVNNVGVGSGAGRLEDMAEAAWLRGVDLNLNSAFLMTRAAIPPLLQGRGRAVVNIASVAGLRAHGTGSYGPSKAALVQFTRELAVIYGRDGLRANAIAPGHIMTPLVERFVGPAAREARRRIAPLGIEGDAWDVAQAALFLAGPEARFISGACLPVDGGVTQVAALAAYERLMEAPR